MKHQHTTLTEQSLSWNQEKQHFEEKVETLKSEVRFLRDSIEKRNAEEKKLEEEKESHLKREVEDLNK